MMRSNIRSAPPARFPILARPVETPIVRRRFRGPWLTLYEWQCAGHGPGRPEEEWADSHEVAVPRRGAFEWEIAGERMLADPGVATFLPAAEPYRVRHPLPGGDGGSVFRLGAAAAAELAGEHDFGAADRERLRWPARHVPLDGRAYLLHCMAMRAAFDPGADPLEVEERALLFLREAVRQAFRRAGAAPRGPAGRSRRAREWVERAREVIARRYREPLTLGEVAREAGCSPFHLSRLVAAATGQPVYRMVLRRRLREALELLLETRESISRIALGVGFASHSHLTEAFRREFGVPPRAVRGGQLSATMKGLPPTRALSFSSAARASSRLAKGPARTL